MNKKIFSMIILVSLAAAPLRAGGEPGSGSELAKFSELFKTVKESGMPMLQSAVFLYGAAHMLSDVYLRATRKSTAGTDHEKRIQNLTYLCNNYGTLLMGTDSSKHTDLMGKLSKAGGILGVMQAIAPEGTLPGDAAFITLTVLTTQLGDYAKTDQIPTPVNLADYAKTADLKGLAKTTDLPAPVDLTGYALKTDLEGLAKTTDLPDFTTFALKADVTALQKAVGTWGSTEQTMAEAIAALQAPSEDPKT